MRARPDLVLFAAASLALVACQGGRNAGNGSASSGTPPGDDAAWVTLERRPCFGTCPVYTVQVSRSGRVTFDGVRFVRDSGRVVDSLPADSVRVLADAIDTARFFEFAAKYVPGEPVCALYATDLPTVVITVSADDRTHRVEHDRGCRGAPESLAALEERIDGIIGTWRWTTGTPQ